MFWVILIGVLGMLVLLFFDSVREYPLAAFLLLSMCAYFVWRAYGFLVGAHEDDQLVWKILLATGGLISAVAVIGILVDRRRARRRDR